MPAPENATEWRGHNMVDRDGEKIGRIDEIYLDTETHRPQWALVHTGLFGTRSTFVPLEGASLEEDVVRVSHEQGVIKDAPGIEPEGDLSPEEEEQLYRYYGLDYSRAGAGGSAGARLRRDDSAEEGRDAGSPEPQESRGEQERGEGTPPHSTGVPPGEATDEFGRPHPPEEGRLG